MNRSLETLDLGFNTACLTRKGKTLFCRAHILSAVKEELRYIYSRHIPIHRTPPTLKPWL